MNETAKVVKELETIWEAYDRLPDDIEIDDGQPLFFSDISVRLDELNTQLLAAIAELKRLTEASK